MRRWWGSAMARARTFLSGTHLRRTLPRPGPAYPGDVVDPVRVSYDPHDDDQPDPGEIVWAWVPYEEDHSQGKDRPALVIGRDGSWLLALPVTSKDHHVDADSEARAGRYWVDIGSGSWDARRRPSQARVNRVVRLAPSSVRRIGARLDRRRFDDVRTAMARHHRSA
ncbi:hypothetical protein KEM60_02389 [Austwickia sp. TVS 96-490-7B]|uniref:type II toxin-antitoxin system PemK/MazF family toxin n=1 Tax=Austwickia sp. TVS 96-490-7B TaxID=2830843 RepID=UPI001C559841|nr:hypothetical protein [Austwickia sp. TVS 96-490-7B]